MGGADQVDIYVTQSEYREKEVIDVDVPALEGRRKKLDQP
jgi:hypothetical protein